MIEIIGTELNQWDTGRSVKVTEASHVHLANQGDSKAVIMELADSQALIPDYLLQTGKQLCVYAVLNGVTIERKMFSVKKRERPENYVYDEDYRNFIYDIISDAQEATEAAHQVAEDLLEAKERGDFNGPKGDPFLIVNQKSGSEIAIKDADKRAFVDMHIFGKTTQDGTPTPDAPVELVSVGDSGSITVNVAGKNDAQSMTIATPNGLPGIPVSSGGNYTDSNGQQWICDEIDLARGVYVQRVGLNIFDGTETYSDFVAYEGNASVRLAHKPKSPAKCTHGKQETEFGWANDSFVWFKVPYFNATTLNEFTEFVAAQYSAGNPVSILYILATPIETPLSEEELAAYASLHTYRGNTTVSNDAGAWMELEYVMDAKKYIDSLVKAPPAWLTNVTLKASAWAGSNSLYSQVVTIPGITEYSKVDLLPSVEQLAIFFNKNVSFVTENDGGVVTVYAIGDKPMLDYTMQAQITEVEV